MSIAELARIRRDKAIVADKVKMLKAAFEDSIADDLAQLAELSVAESNATEIVKAEAMEAFTASGDKKGYAGCEVKTFKTKRYADGDAFAWAKETGLALALDKKAFEKLADAQELPFVEYGEEPRVTVKSDLSEFVA